MRKSSIFLGIGLVLIIALTQLHPLQAQMTITISGRITDEGGRGVDGVFIAFNDGEEPGYTATSGGGYYSYTVYPEWTGTITPDDACYDFSPQSSVVGPLTGDTTQDFTGTRYTYTLSGVISNGPPVYAGENLLNPLQGIQLTLTTGGSTLTNYSGAYTATVPCGWMGAVTPQKAGWTFTPPSQFYEFIECDMEGQNFTGTASNTEYVISGTITDTANGTGMDGVEIAFSDGLTATTTTGGSYSHTVGINWAGTAVPFYPGYLFTPPLAAIGPVQENTTQDFSAQAIAALPYCEARGNPDADLGIVSVTVSTGTQVSEITAYTAYTDSVFTNLVLNKVHTFEISYRNNKDQAVEAVVGTYIDWDNNHVLDEDCTLHCGSITLGAGEVMTHTGSFVVPQNAAEDAILMRTVIAQKTDLLNRAPACGIAFDGEVEDYIVNNKLLHFFYLPLILKNAMAAPDLVVESLTAATDTVQVVIKNQGTIPVNDPFWVDVYIDPSVPPTAANQVWRYIADQGLVWGITADVLPLSAGEVLTLTTGDTMYASEHSQVVWPLAVGTPLYAQVDSANTETTYGGVLEDHEITHDIYNNIWGPVRVANSSAAIPSMPETNLESDTEATLPSR